MGTFLTSVKSFWETYWSWVVLGIIFCLFIFTRTYQLLDRSGFGWDQTTIAWAVKHLLVDHQLQLIGMPAKLNTGFYIGPLYYYYAAIFFWLTNLAPIASPLMTICTAIINFFIIFFVVKKLFNKSIALVTVSILTTSSFLINADRTQWPVTFIPSIAILIFYALYKASTKSPRYLLLLGLFIGVSFHIHFTSVFFPIYTALALPLMKRNRQTFVYLLGGIGISVLFLIPNIIFSLETNNSSGNHLIYYISSTFQMFHGRHFLQLLHDAFIQFDLIFSLGWFSRFVPLILLACLYILAVKNASTQTRIVAYLIGIWVLVPWIAFTLYTGELTDYYFSVTRPIALTSSAFLIVWLWQRKHFIWKIALFCFLSYTMYSNITNFLSPQHGTFLDVAKRAQDTIKAGQTIQYSEGVPEAYFYYAYTREKNK